MVWAREKKHAHLTKIHPQLRSAHINVVNVIPLRYESVMFGIWILNLGRFIQFERVVSGV